MVRARRKKVPTGNFLPHYIFKIKRLCRVCRSFAGPYAYLNALPGWHARCINNIQMIDLSLMDTFLTLAPHVCKKRENRCEWIS